MLKVGFIFLLILIVGVFFYLMKGEVNKNLTEPQVLTEVIKSIPLPSPSPSITPIEIPISKTLNNDYHIFQSFNNCGPAALSMALSYYGINKSQQELGEQLRPYQVSGGNNDDKSVTLEELAEKAKEFRLIPYLRPNGNHEIIKKFIAVDIPVITRTWLKENDDIGHYRIIKGYDDNTNQFIQDDSLQGKNLRYSYQNFDKIWDKFNYEYLILIPKDKQSVAEQILGENLDEKIAWQKAVELSQEKLNLNPDDTTARFNLSVAYYKLGDYQKSVEEFEKVENQLPFRTLWYQIEPIQAYYELGRVTVPQQSEDDYQLGNYDRVFQITEKVLNNHNRAFSELYLLRGNIYLKQANPQAAKQEFEKAVMYNRNLKSAQDALASVN